jgi:hypothetical protein
VGIKDDVDPKLIGGLPDLPFYSRMTVCPGIADISRVVISDKSTVDNPAECVGSSMRSDDREAWK